jgi:hypothetical protein
MRQAPREQSTVAKLHQRVVELLPTGRKAVERKPYPLFLSAAVLSVFLCGYATVARSTCAYADGSSH